MREEGGGQADLALLPPPSSLVPRLVSWLLPPFLFAALAAAFLAPVLFSHRALLPTGMLMQMSPWAQTRPAAPTAAPPEPWNPILWDAIAQFYPWRAFAAHWMRRGIIPLWDPHQFCGTPFLANSQSAVLYPLHLLLLDLPAGLPVARAMALLAATHLALAGFLTYLWLRALRLSSFAAVLGGITFMLSGFAVTWLELPSFLAVACWLPLLFLTIHRVIEAPPLASLRSCPRAAAVAVAIGLTLLGGHLQVAFYCLLGAGLYAVWSLIARSPDRLNVRTPALLLLALLLGGLLAAPQLLPAVELSHRSHRVGAASAAGYQAYVGGAMPAAQLVRLFLPDFYGNPSRGDYVAGSPSDYTEYAAYFGGVGLWLALAGLLAWRRRPRAALFPAGLAGLALLMALGTPLDAVLYFGIPGFSQSGSPARILVLFCFAGAWLAALGTQALVEERDAAEPPELLAPSPAGEVAEPRTGSLAMEAGPARPPSGVQNLEAESGTAHAPAGTREPTRANPRRLRLTPPAVALAALLLWALLLAASLLSARGFMAANSADFGALMAESVPALQRAVLFVVLAAGLPQGLRWLGQRGSVSPSLAGGLGRGMLAALLVGELWRFGAGFNPTGPLSEVYPSTPLIAALRSGTASGSGRVLPVNHHWSLFQNPHALLPPNSALALGLFDPQGYDSLFIGRYKGFANLVQGEDTAPPENGNMLFLSNLTSPLLPLLAADRIVANDGEGVRGGGGERATRSEGARVGLDVGHSPALDYVRSPSRPLAPSSSRWPLLYAGGGLQVRRNPAALPRAFVAPNWRVVPDAAAAAELLRIAANHTLGTTSLVTPSRPSTGDPQALNDPVALLRPDPKPLRRGTLPSRERGVPQLSGFGGTPRSLPPKGAQADPVAIRDQGPDAVTLTLRRPEAGMLVLLDNAYPGWHATDAASGRALPLHRVDLTFRGIVLARGTQAVRLRYEPASFRLGLYLAALAFGAIVAAIAAGSRLTTEAWRHGE